MKVQYNQYDDELWCIECKDRIHLGEKYITIKETLYDDSVISKQYHPDCVPEMEEDDEYE